MERRVMLKLIAAGFLPAAGQDPSRLVSLTAAAASYKPQFFSADQMQVLDRLTEIIIPADDHSPGASAAQVNVYIDVIASESDAEVQRSWRSGLRSVGDEAGRRFGKSTAECSGDELEQIVAAMARNENAPQTELESFFGMLKRATIDGYYTSKIGIHEDLQYQGNTALSEFPGCTHDAH